ncbi:MAG: hypothetical protein JWQ76_1745 [Ramlibacter sp.]|nr:hypothetical protein [Ramlibacter sp.]
MNLTWILATRRAAGLAAAAAAAATLMACTTMGTGMGSESPGNQPVAFSWTSKDGGITGTMSATVDANAQFSGPFLQVTHETHVDAMGPMWDGLAPGWSDWGGWSVWGLSDDAFVTSYSGKVLADLKGANGQQMRCRFQLNDPMSGMGGGGQGDCQVAGGRKVSAVFARA